MDSKTAYKQGLSLLDQFWNRVGEDTEELPLELRSRISGTMSPDAQVSQRYALISQLLLKALLGVADSRSLENFGDDRFSARTFAKYTVAGYPPVTRRLGNSSDPYVSNPLRAARLEDALTQGRGGKQWAGLLAVLDAVDDRPELVESSLIHALALVRELPDGDPTPKVAHAAPEVAADLSSLLETSGLESNLLLDILEVMESDQPQIILAGPPGTSKTHTAQAVASYITDAADSRVTTVQLHATYGYEDFVEGLRPVVSASGTLAFEVEPGALVRASRAVEPGSKDRHVMILDEMNRANLPRVMGELLFAIERRGEAVDLLHTAGFRLPEQLCFIGTMNTADRSIRSIDAAVRRRFMIFELQPSAETLESFYLRCDNEVPDLIEGFSRLNDYLTELIDRHHTIGHTFLMDRRGMTSGRLNQVWLRQIRPLVEEYLFDMPDELTRFTVDAFWPSVSS